MPSTVGTRSSLVSRVLFLSETGEPMRFFLRPGAIKAHLQPIISAGGGVVCKVQEPNAILLMDPEELNKVPGSSAPQYVSSQYILDCVEKNQQLEVDDYRFKDDDVQTGSTKRKSVGNGRMGYSAEEDAAILRFIQCRKQAVRGNRLWQQMERDGITGHTWQSMKARYLKHLEKQPLEGDAEVKQKTGEGQRSPIKPSNRPSEPLRQVDPLAPSHKKAQLQPSHEEKDTNCSPERTHPQPSSDPTSTGHSPKRPRAQRSPEKMQPQASLGRTPRQPPLDQARPQPATNVEIPSVLSKRTNPVCMLYRMPPCALSGAGQPHSLAGKGRSEGKDAAGPSSKSIGTNGQLAVTEPVEEHEQRPAPRKRKLGILESAVKEFEDLDESDDDTPDLAFSSTSGVDGEGQNKEIPVTTSAEVIQEKDDDDDDDDANKDKSEPQPEKCPDAQQGPSDGDEAPGVSSPAQKTPVPLTSKVHMFLFDRESQDEGPSLPAGEPSLTQGQVRNARQELRYLMRGTSRGLDVVSKALLRTSGDVQAALEYLCRGQQEYMWDPRDDGLLGSGSASLLPLEKKYGKVAVARRIAFLDIE